MMELSLVSAASTMTPTTLSKPGKNFYDRKVMAKQVMLE